MCQVSQDLWSAKVPVSQSYILLNLKLVSKTWAGSIEISVDLIDCYWLLF